jgi:hypothetical protein
MNTGETKIRRFKNDGFSMVEVTGFGRLTPFAPPAILPESYRISVSCCFPHDKPVLTQPPPEKQKTPALLPEFFNAGRGDWIRTSGLYVPNAQRKCLFFQ